MPTSNSQRLEKLDSRLSNKRRRGFHNGEVTVYHVASLVDAKNKASNRKH
jgi:hypothetical protein